MKESRPEITNTSNSSMLASRINKLARTTASIQLIMMLLNCLDIAGRMSTGFANINAGALEVSSGAMANVLIKLNVPYSVMIS